MHNDQSESSTAQQILCTSSGDFVALLDRLGFSLVLSARPDNVIFVGAVDGKLEVESVRVSQPIGLAAGGSRLALASPRTVTIYSNVSLLAPHYPGRPNHYDAYFVPRRLYFTGECHMHDMTFEGEALIGANTNFSCISRVDSDYSFTPLWTPGFITEISGDDRCHLNGFASEDGQLKYVTALSASNEPKGWRNLPDSGGVLIDAERGTILRSDLCMPHSPRIVRGELYVLNGGEGEVLRVDRKTGMHSVIASLPGFTHGLTTLGGVLFVGMSQNRVSRSKNPPPVAQRFPTLTAGVAVIDPRNGILMGSLAFTAGVSEVFDVQILPGVRRAGMQNILGSDGFTAVETPAAAFWSKRPQNDIAHVMQVAESGNYDIQVRKRTVTE
jgi:uncharacterized protein (TIGR03032 family)